MKPSTRNLTSDRQFKQQCLREARRIAKRRAQLKTLAKRDKKGLEHFHD